MHEGACGFQALLEYLRVALPDLFLLFLCDRPVAQGGAVVGSALEDGQVADLLGDLGDELDCGCAGANDANALAGQVHAFLGPAPGVAPGALEVVEALEVGDVVGRQQTDGSNQELAARLVAVLHRQFPAVGVLVIDAGRDAGVEADVLTEVELVGHVVEVALVLGLPGIQLFPVPFL